MTLKIRNMKKVVRVRLFEAQGNSHVWQLIFKTKQVGEAITTSDIALKQEVITFLLK
jgi:hypothetical protein